MIELLDIVDDEGFPIGQWVERKEAHAKGIQHRTTHVWLARKNPETGKTEILLQLRSQNKDSYPGCYDISSAGHVPMGVDYVPSALRELQEELGVEASPEDLIYCGQRKIHYEDTFHGKYFIDNQISNVYVMWCDREAEQFQLQESEVESVRWIGYDECCRLVREKRIPNCIRMEELMMIGRVFGGR